MTQQEKLIALCQYLPYGVEAIAPDGCVETLTGLNSGVVMINHSIHGWESHEDIKLILRPLFSMTEEEKREMKDRFHVLELEYVIGPFGDFLGEFLSEDTGNTYFPIPEQCRQWLLEKHFDLFGLIGKFAVERK